MIGSSAPRPFGILPNAHYTTGCFLSGFPENEVNSYETCAHSGCARGICPDKRLPCKSKSREKREASGALRRARTAWIRILHCARLPLGWWSLHPAGPDIYLPSRARRAVTGRITGYPDITGPAKEGIMSELATIVCHEHEKLARADRA